MGRNLWVNEADFSRAFTVLVWDDLLGVLPPRPDPVEAWPLRVWVEQVLQPGVPLPTIYQIWRDRGQGCSESDVAYAKFNGGPVMIEGVHDELRVRPVRQFPALDYNPPEWTGSERFAQAFRGTSLSLQAAPLQIFFRSELERLRQALQGERLEWGLL